jgi:hypothetical protein
MTAEIKFNLDDPDDMASFKTMNKAKDLAAVLWDLKTKIREKTKYGEFPDNPHDEEVWEEISTLFHDLIAEHDCTEAVNL